MNAEQVKSCCVAAYGHDLVGLLLGESYHPGGLRLTRRLADALALRPGARVLDVACGTGASTLLLAREHGAVVDGIDLGPAAVAAATAAAAEAGLTDRVHVQVADAEALPFEDGVFDAVVCECALCTFPDKSSAAREFARVLRPGGRLGLTDVTVSAAGLPAELDDIVGWVSCLADAQPLDTYADILARAGLDPALRERHDGCVHEMVSQIGARLRVLRMTAGSNPQLAQIDFERALALAGHAAAAVQAGQVGYALIVATKSSGQRRSPRDDSR